jgi:lipoic acid synthetase
MPLSLPVISSDSPPERRKPSWLKVRAPGGPNYIRLKALVREGNLHTVCEEARCPNIGECWEERTATFMILGGICTRSCGYCAVAHGRPAWEDREEPERVARAIAALELDHAVVTSVNRDDLADGGAAHFAATIRAIRKEAPGCGVEVLIPDFKGSAEALASVVAQRPDVLGHNVETVSRLYKIARPGGRYDRALALLGCAHSMAPDLLTKSGILLGLGESEEELLQTMRELREAGVKLLTLGQYLRPSHRYLPVDRFYSPDEFAGLAREGLRMGFLHVESGPLVRSSYHAKRQVTAAAGGAR